MEKNNLHADRFQNGDPILQAQSKDEWMTAIKEKTPAYCIYATSENEMNTGKYKTTHHKNDDVKTPYYGKYYNFYAVIDHRGLAPQGWRIPNNSDWIKLADNLYNISDIEKIKTLKIDMKYFNEDEIRDYLNKQPEKAKSKIMAIRMKTQDIYTPKTLWKPFHADWKDDNAGNNNSGFSARGAGARNNIGFEGQGSRSIWWTLERDKDGTNICYIHYSVGLSTCWCPYSNIIPSFENWPVDEGCEINAHGFPVRLISDGSNL